MKYKNRLLVTGGAGFIGSAFLRNLVPKYPEWFFVNLDLLTYAGDLKKVESIANSSNYLFINGDICDRKLIEEIFEEHGINWVVNFAAESHVDNSIEDSYSFIKTNVVGIHVLLEVAKHKWLMDGKEEPKKHFRFLQISTDEVYGSLREMERPWVENDVLLPNSPYAASKAAAEMLCRSYKVTFKLPVLVTRSSNNFGPFQNSEKFIPKIINSILNSDFIPIYGNGTNIRDWIFVDDNINAIEKLLLQGIIGEIYNIGGNNELTNLDLVEKIQDNLGLPARLKFVDDRLGHDFRYCLNVDKIRNLGWEPTTNFSSHIKSTIKYYKNVKEMN